MTEARVPGEADRTLTVLAGGQPYALPAEHVLEVALRPSITRVPNGPAAMAGLMNFHGVAIPVVSVAALVDGKPRPSSGEAKVVVYDERGAVALLIDDVQQLTVGRDGSARSLNLGELLAAEFGEAAPTPRRASGHFLKELQQQVAVADERALLSFRVSCQHFALPLETVAEVLTLPARVTDLPKSAAASMGMITLRDEVVPLISLAALLGLGENAEGRHHVVVVRFEDARIGLVVDRLDGVLRVPETSIEPVPPILQRGAGDAEIDALARGNGGRPLLSILSPARLFRNREVRVALADQGNKENLMPSQLSAEPDLRFIVFSVGDDVFGLPIEAVDEIVQLPDAISRVPNAPPFVKGVINVRGSAVPVIDQRMRFGAGPAEMTRRPRVILVTIESLRAGFIVDAVSEILSVPAAAIRPAPNLPGSDTQVFDRVATRGEDNSLILLVDRKELLDKAERDLLERFGSTTAPAQPS